MAKSIKIVPTLLTHSFLEFKDKIKKVERYFSLVQIDIMDGKFVKNKTFSDLIKIKKIKTPVMYELHLMVKKPLNEIKKWEKYKKVKKIVFHYEAIKNEREIRELIEYLKSKKLNVGLAINPETQLEKIRQFIPKINTLFLLGVVPGWGGQTLKPLVLNKAKFARKKYPKLDIEIDGGVNLENLEKIIDSGVNIIAAGTMIFGAEDIEKRIKEVDKLIK